MKGQTSNQTQKADIAHHYTAIHSKIYTLVYLHAFTPNTPNAAISNPNIAVL